MTHGEAKSPRMKARHCGVATAQLSLPNNKRQIIRNNLFLSNTNKFT